MTTRNVLLWLHIVVAFVTMGPLILFDMVTPPAIRAGNTGFVRWLADKGARLGPATVLIAVLGISMVVRDDFYSFKQEWIIAALAIYAVMVANGIGILEKTIHQAADKMEAGEDATAEASKLAKFGSVNIVLFLAILWLMVAKPGI